MSTTRRAAAPSIEALGPHEELARAFKAAMAAMRRLKGRETHHPGTLSYAQFGLLFSLAEGEARSARELADAAALTPSTVTQMLESLEAHGLVRRLRSDTDRRVVLTTLTDRGRDLVSERRARFESRWRAALAEFSPDELRTAATVLDRLARHFEDLACGS
jgi:DNA-binding MarR family transcriptional regulator